MGCLLDVTGLGYQVPGGHTLLEDINFKLHRHETLAVVGPSGSGKSTLLRCLNRLNEPSAGQLRLHEREYDRYPVTELRRRVGLVFQLPALFPGTVADNVAYGPRLRHGGPVPKDHDKVPRATGKVPRAAARTPGSGHRVRKAVDQALKAVGLADMSRQSADTLSVGQAQRVCLARALANGPDLLLLDEPTSALDRNAARQVEALLYELRREFGLAWVVVTHDEAQGLRLADKALRLEAGRGVALGPASEVLERKAPTSYSPSNPTGKNGSGRS